MKTIIILILSTFLVMSFSQTPARYEYLTMTQSTFYLKVSINNEKFTSTRLWSGYFKDIEKGDFRPTLEKIQEFENEGWELVTSNVFTDGSEENYVMMRRRR